MNKQAMVSYIELTAAELDAADKMLKQAEEQRTGYLSHVTATVDRLVAKGHLQKEAAANAAAILADPKAALDQLVKLAESQLTVGEPATPIGTGVPGNSKTAAANPAPRQPSNREAINRAFVVGLGLDPSFA